MIVASRYAKSLMDLATEKGLTDAAYADMIQIKSVCEGSREFRAFLNSPIIQSEKKISVLQSIFEGKLNPITFGFLTVVISKRREVIIPEIANSFIAQYKTHKHILTVVITSANGLDAATKQQALDVIKTQLKGEVELVEKTDANLIGGFILKIGDTQLDKSVSRQLSSLKKVLTNKALN